MPLFGKDAKLYYSSALKTTASDSDALTWTEVTAIGDLTDSFSPTDVDITTRATAALGWEATATVLKSGEITFTYIPESVVAAGDATFAALLAAFLNGTAIAMMDLSGAKSAVTSIGLAANFSVGMTWGKPVKGVQTSDFTLKIRSFPEWVTGSATL